MEFIVEVPIRRESLATPVEKEFEITEKTLDNVRSSKVGKIPEFTIKGKLHRTNCLIHMPLTGEVTIVKSANKISSIDVQLVRIESISSALSSSGDLSKGDMVKEATEIEKLQIAVGDVVRNMVIPIYMVLPRVYTCPTLSTATFAVGFEVNLQVVLEDGYMVSETVQVGRHRVQ